MKTNKVISYRTDRINELKKVATEKDVSLSNLTSMIIDDYLEYYSLVKNFKMFCVGRKEISAVFEHLDKQAMEEIIKIATMHAYNSIKIATNEFSLEKVVSIIGKWFKYNEFDLREFHEKETIKLICKIDMSKKFNEYVSKVIENLFNKFNYQAISLHDFDMIEIKVSKQKHL